MSTESEMIHAQRRAFEGPGYSRHLIGPDALSALFDKERELAAAQKEIERLKAEIPKAFKEGFETIDPCVEFKIVYNHSRAKRIAEGKE